MADKQNKKLSNLFFFGVSFVNFDITDISLDIITNIRKRFLITKKPASNKLYRSAQGENFVYAYNFSFDRPLQWRVTRNKKVVEEIEQLLSGKYCINLYDEQGGDLKKTFFDTKHRWFKTNYYSSVSNDNLVCSLVPKEFEEGTSILRYNTGEVYPERLYSCSIPSDEVVRARVLSRIPTPLVTALTNAGTVYFMPEDDKENYEHILKEEEKIFKAENAPKVYVSEEDVASGFNLSVKDFDMSKNLNRTFDISLAEDFDADSKPEMKISTPEEEPLTQNLSSKTEDDGSVDAAITDIVEQINARTSLDIDADEILNIDLGVADKADTEELSADGDYISFDTSEFSVDEQLKHIDSVLDGSSLLNSERKLVIGDSVVDDDYISSIIDGIISSAFSGDDNTLEADNTFESADIAEPEVESIEPVNPEEASVDTIPQEDISDENTDTPSVLEEVCEDIQSSASKIYSAKEYITETPADIIIESRGEVYSYYGTVDENGKRSGRGRTLMSDGSIAYEGEYEDDKRKGQGSFYFKDGTLCYWGNWDGNFRSGFGLGVSSEDKAVHVGGWTQNKPSGLGARFDADGSLMFISSNCEDKKKGITISDFSDTSFTVRVWSEKDDAFIQREININDIIK